MSAPPPASDPRLRIRIVAAFATIYLVWGSTFLAIRLGVRELPPLLFAGGRFLLAGALLTVIAVFLGERWPRTRREWGWLLAFSLLMISLSNGASTIALQYLPSNEGALLAAGSALWIAFLGSLGPHGHALSTRAIVGLLIGFVGVALIVWPRADAPRGHLGWQAMVLFGGFVWSVGTVLYRNARLPVGPVAFNAVIMGFGGLWLSIAGVASDEAQRWRWDASGLLALAYLAVFGSALAYTAYAWLLKHASADRVGTFAYVNPAVAALLGWVVLDERLGGRQLLGMLIVIAGVALVTLPSRLLRVASAGFSART